MSVRINKPKQFAAILIVIILIAIPISVFYVLPILKVTPVPGVSVHRTVFADLVSEVPDPVMFPTGEMTNSSDTFHMKPTSGSIVNESQVYDAATEFLNLEPWLQSENYSVHDDPTFDERWYTGFSGEIVHGDIDVNPLSGKVLRYRVFWEGDPPFAPNLNDSSILDKDTIEQCAVEFLTRHNYSLSPYARYSEPIIGDRIVGPDYLVYKLVFHNVVDGAIISEHIFHNLEMGSLYLYLDPHTGTVVQIFYLWTHIPSLPVFRAMPIHWAEAIAIRHMSSQIGNSSLSLSKATLVFERMGSMHSHNYFLAWVLFYDSPGWDIHIDAISGEILAESIMIVWPSKR